MPEVYYVQHWSGLDLILNSEEFDWTNHTSKPYSPGFTNFFRQTRYGQFNTASGEYQPAWKSIIRNEGDATTPFIGRDMTVETDWFSSTVFWERGPSQSWPDHDITERNFFGYLPSVKPAVVALPAAVQTRVTNRCIAKFNQSVQNAQSSILAGEVISDLSKTLHSITHPLDSLKQLTVGYLSSLKKKKARFPASKLPKVLSDSYLEWRFGINPLLGDIAQGIVNLGSYRYPWAKVESSAHEIFSGSNTSGSFALPSGAIASPIYFYTDKVTSQYQVRYKGAVRTGALDTVADGSVGLAQDLRLYPKYWIPTIWEVIPYSWVVDYFTNVGDIVNSFSVAIADVVWGCKTTRLMTSDDFRITSMRPYDFGSSSYTHQLRQSVYGGNTTSTDKAVTRSRLTSDDLVPRFQFEIPVSSRPWENLAALLTSKLSGVVPFSK